MKMTAVYRKKDEIAGRSIAGESFLIPVCGRPVDLENIFVLNPMADYIWQRLDGERTVAEVLAAIVDDFSVEPEQAQADLTDLIGQLLGNGLIEKQP
jgi:hypothetical protein